MSETLRYHLYNSPPRPEIHEVDPRELRFHECRTILNMSQGLAELLLNNYDPEHCPIRIYGKDVIDGPDVSKRLYS